LSSSKTTSNGDILCEPWRLPLAGGVLCEPLLDGVLRKPEVPVGDCVGKVVWRPDFLCMCGDWPDDDEGVDEDLLPPGVGLLNLSVISHKLD
jgi:hypothetical protein